jgi:SAM-dependent methyltransferase
MIECPVCSGESLHKWTVPVDAKTFRPTPHGSVHECTECTTWFVYPRPSPADTAEFYNLESYFPHGESHLVPVGTPSFSSRLRSHLAWRADFGKDLLEVVSSNVERRGKIVDIGCGSGRLVRNLLDRDYLAVGVERDVKTLALLIQQGVPALEGSAESLPKELGQETCDAVIFDNVLEHLSDPIDALRKAAMILKPGGKLFCELPNNESYTAQQSGVSWEHLDIPRHLNFFNEKSLTVAFKIAGLRIFKTYFSGYCRYYSDAYIATEQRIYDNLPTAARGLAGTKRNSNARAWALLAKSALARPRRKYDTLGIIAYRT